MLYIYTYTMQYCIAGKWVKILLFGSIASSLSREF